MRANLERNHRDTGKGPLHTSPDGAEGDTRRWQKARANTKVKSFETLISGNKGHNFKFGVSPTAAITLAAQLTQIGIWLAIAERTLDPAVGRQIRLDALFSCVRAAKAYPSKQYVD